MQFIIPPSLFRVYALRHHHGQMPTRNQPVWNPEPAVRAAPDGGQGRPCRRIRPGRRGDATLAESGQSYPGAQRGAGGRDECYRLTAARGDGAVGYALDEAGKPRPLTAGRSTREHSAAGEPGRCSRLPIRRQVFAKTVERPSARRTVSSARKTTGRVAGSFGASDRASRTRSRNCRGISS